MQVKPLKLMVKSVGKTFLNGNREINTLEDINLEIKTGEFVCILGPSGCGKSTLLNIIAGLDKPTGGEILLQGKNVTGPGPDRVLMFQESALFPWLSVIQNVEFGLEMVGIPRARRRTIAQDFLRMVNLTDYEKSCIHQLSGGMKQRVALARALAVNSEVLLMDEPFAALDPEIKNSLHNELLDIWQKTGKTIVFVTHSIEEAVTLADRVVVMSSGPGKIKKDFTISSARPRNLEQPILKGLVRAVKNQLRQQGPYPLKEEGGSDWVPSESNILLNTGRPLGRSI